MAERSRLTIPPERLRRLRLAAVLSRQQLAHLSGVSERRIDQIEGEGFERPTRDRAPAGLSARGSVRELVEVLDD